MSWLNGSQRVQQPVNIHGTIRVRDRVVGTRAVDERVNATPSGAKRKRASDIHRPDFILFGGEAFDGFLPCAEAKHGPAVFGKQIGCDLTKETAAGYDDPWQGP
jgi:hypothetical protein